MSKATLSQIAKIIQDQMDTANASCCTSLLKIWDKIGKLDWDHKEEPAKPFINIVMNPIEK